MAMASSTLSVFYLCGCGHPFIQGCQQQRCLFLLIAVGVFLAGVLEGTGVDSCGCVPCSVVPLDSRGCVLCVCVLEGVLTAICGHDSNPFCVFFVGLVNGHAGIQAVSSCVCSSLDSCGCLRVCGRVSVSIA